MANKKLKLVCHCNGVNEKEILRLLKRGAKDMEDVKKFTLASTGCGKCRTELESIVNLFLTNRQIDVQLKINI